MKKVKYSIILLCFIIIISGCGKMYKFSTEINYDPQKIMTPKENFIFKNYQYFDDCKNKYQDFKLVGDGEYRCLNNGITIEFKTFSNKDGLYDFGYTYPDNNDKKLFLAEINKLFKMNNLTEMNEKQLDTILENNHIMIFNNIEFFYNYDESLKEHYFMISGQKTNRTFDKDRYLN
ncbi:MAG: hypothetical protein LBT75_03605 [Bacilli bacterium]|jgi:hypothetical protein|nr:hypothetical protein [Bacilli bacterium]